jgi:Tfp pilus assembly protein PilX
VDRNRGVALILALLVLSFLSVLGGALLTTSTIDIWISDNYKTATQSLYLAEAGMDHGRELIRTSPRSTSELLAAAAGMDLQLGTADDQPLIARRTVESSPGFYEVWLRNDNADGAGAWLDSNETVTLISISEVGSSRKTIEATIRRGGFPETPADPRLQTVTGLEGLVATIVHNADTVYTESVLNNIGSPVDYRVVSANGNLELGPGTGYGVLLVQGELTLTGSITWNGLILVIGQGVVRWSAGAIATVNGGFFVAKTRTPSGSLLAAPESVTFSITDPAEMKTANRRFPFNPIAIREK